jgi:hypothetical protein
MRWAIFSRLSRVTIRMSYSVCTQQDFARVNFGKQLLRHLGLSFFSTGE